MCIMSLRSVLLLAIVAIAATLMTVPVAQAETVLRWASAGGALTFDPHGHDHGPTEYEQHQVYERLIGIDQALAVVPVLTTTWSMGSDAKTWDFELRQGVKFHDGAPFTSDDVVFTIDRARSERSERRAQFEHIVAVEPLSDHSVRITTSRPDLLLPVRLSRIFIMSRAWAERHGTVAPSRPNDAEQGYAATHANGTGPFRLVAFDATGRSVMVRNPDWWGGVDKPVAIDRIVHEIMPDPNERLSALLDRSIDFLIDPPLAALEKIRATPGVKIEQTMEFRTIFLVLDQISTELRSSDIKGRNPFKDRSVRRAMYQAIDIEHIRRDVMQGFAFPAGMIIQPRVNGYSPELDRRLPFDPEGAKRLLVSAGYSDGFSVRLDCPNNRYVNDDAICRAIAEQLGAIGISVTVDAQRMNDHLAKVFSRETDFYMLGWNGNSTFDSVGFLQDWYQGDGGNRHNVSGFANPRVDELIAAIDAELVTYARDALIQEAWRIVIDDVALLPLHHQVMVWALREDLDLTIDPNSVPWFQNARFEAPGQE